MMKAKRSNVNMEKLTVMTIAFNGVQILSSLLIALICLLDAEVLGRPYLRVGLVILTALVSWGAFMDVREAYMARRLSEETDMLEESHRNLEELNGEMRKQRHDFMNHLQVVYSLIEMDEPGEAIAYMDKIYGDMQRVSNMLRTACPAVNALIQAKVVEAGERGAQLKLSIAAKWDDQLMPAWEICRVLANLIDNALDATCAAEHPEGEMPTVELVLGEDLRSWFFSVRNNGPAIPEKVRAKIFEPGFTTKATGQGMGLYIVSQTVIGLGGQITVESHDGDTVFSGFVPRKHLKLSEGHQECEENSKKNDEIIK